MIEHHLVSFSSLCAFASNSRNIDREDLINAAAPAKIPCNLKPNCETFMNLHGQNFIGYQLISGGGEAFRAVSPADSSTLPPAFHAAGENDVNTAMELAETAFDSFRETTGEQRAVFLERIADEIMALGDELLVRANLETGLPAARLTGERARTVNQLKSFAQTAREGSWVDARIDTAIPDRQPVPKPDLRRMLIPIGPVIVFGASNFPFAYSVAGGDTASALATGNPVVVKAHERHPGTFRAGCDGDSPCRSSLQSAGWNFFNVAWPWKNRRHGAGETFVCQSRRLHRLAHGGTRLV